MEICKIENLTFKYPASDVNALYGISVSVKDGEFITVCGKSGCGKSTLLRELKPVLSPHGEKSGIVYFKGQEITETDFRIQSGEIGFVGQDPDNQIVTDKVWHELAFGAESLGMPSEQIRVRVAEMASFFGIETWFHKSTSELSGGQKQLLNLASVMVMQPSLLLLDEPASQLDPIAAHEFLRAVSKINRELGITVILTEHRLEEAFAISDRVLVMDNGSVIADGAPSEIGGKLKGNDMFFALPAAMRIYGAVDGSGKYPVTVREGREWLSGVSANSELIKEKEYPSRGECVVEVENVYFRYEKNLPDVIRGLSMSVCKGEIYAVMGGNGTGKSTMLSLISGIFRAYRGEVRIEGKPVLEISDLYRGCMGVLPQNPQSLFVKKTVFLDLSDVIPDKYMTAKEREQSVKDVSKLCGLDGLLERHPYDLSGGEQQRAALAKVLLTKPRILLLDEPTKGLDAHFKRHFAAILKNLTASGVTVIMVSHDIEFCAEYADRCAMFFDGNIVSEGTPREFFAGNSFYTTASNRMARNLIENAVLAEDIIRACGKEMEDEKPIEYKTEQFAPRPHDEPKKIKKPKIIRGIIFAVLFLVSLAFVKANGWISHAAQFLSILFLGISLDGFIPQKELGGEVRKGSRKLTKRTALSAAMGIIAVPITMYVGIYFLGDRKYYFISLLIVIETLIPFFAAFEQRKPQARELVVISVLCAIAVAGRAALYMLPQFKPVIAIVIIAAVCFGAETGFLTGAVTGFVSNFFAGQGPWTPWQMFALGIVGFLAGVLFQKGFLRRTRGSLCIFGGVATVLIYGVVLNISSAIMAQESLNAAVILSYFAMGLPFDIIHAAATVFFLWTASVPMIEKLERIKTKYGIIGR